VTSPPLIFDRRLVRARRARAAAGFAAFLHEAAGRDLAERLGAVTRSFPLALDLSAGTGATARALLATGKVGALVHAEAVEALAAGLPPPVVVADEEALPFRDEAFDLAVSTLSLQGVNDLPGSLLQIRRLLRPDGLFLGSVVGAGTLAELRTAFLEAEEGALGGASPRVAPFADVRDAGTLLQRAGFALPVADADRLVVRYASPFELFRDLRAMGMTNPLVARSRRPLARAALLRAAAIYAERFSDPDGRVRATFVIVSLSGWAPHASQPKPLRPGSAKVSLADVLGRKEGRE